MNFNNKPSSTCNGTLLIFVSAPTGTGKPHSRFPVEMAINDNQRLVTLLPLALVNQKYRSSPDTMGMISVSSPVMSLTSRRPGSCDHRNTSQHADYQRPSPCRYRLGSVDEIHYLNHPERGTVWEELFLWPQDIIFWGCHHYSQR